jgi:hypothetical protein
MAATALWIIAAVLAQGVLVFIILALLYQARIPLVLQGKVRIADIAIDKEAWPERSRLVANALSNQFEVPVLFFVAALVSLYFGPTLIEMIVAWLFVISRYVHAYIHVTTNHVVHRFSVYATGVVIVGLFWLELLIRLIAVAVGGS